MNDFLGIILVLVQAFTFAVICGVLGIGAAIVTITIWINILELFL